MKKDQTSLQRIGMRQLENFYEKRTQHGKGTTTDTHRQYSFPFS